MQKKFLILIFACAFGLTSIACNKSGSSNSGLLALLLGGGGSANSITSFSINGSAGTIDQSAGTITLTLPCSTPAVTGLVAVFTHNGAAITANSTAQESGVTANNFTTPVAYTVIAGNGDTKDYTVTVNVAADDSTGITAYSINGVAGVIDGTDITVTLPCTTGSITNLVATFSILGAEMRVGGVSGTIQTSGVTPNNFTGSVTYTVIDCHGTSQDYTVTVTIAPDDSKAITAFSINGQAGIFIVDHIHVTLPAGTSMSNLAATFTATGSEVRVGSTVQTSGVTTNNFTNPVTYTVEACNGTSKNYIVEVDTFTVETTSYDDDPAPNTVTGRTRYLYKNASEYLASLVISQSGTQLPVFDFGFSLMTTSQSILMMSSSAGGDTNWFTDDDTNKSMFVKQYVDATHKRLVQCSDFTGTIAGYYAFTYDGSGRITSCIYYTGNGGDGIWFTFDDVMNSTLAAIWNVTWNTSTNSTSISYEDNGSTIVNQFSSTRDTSTELDVITIFQANGTTVSQQLATDFSHELKGLILIMGTTEFMCQKGQLDGSNRKVWDKIYSATAAAPDGDWWDGDEVFGVPSGMEAYYSPYTVYTYDVNGYRALSSSYSDESGFTQVLHSTTSCY